MEKLMIDGNYKKAIICIFILSIIFYYFYDYKNILIYLFLLPFFVLILWPKFKYIYYQKKLLYDIKFYAEYILLFLFILCVINYHSDLYLQSTKNLPEIYQLIKNFNLREIHSFGYFLRFFLFYISGFIILFVLDLPSYQKDDDNIIEENSDLKGELSPDRINLSNVKSKYNIKNDFKFFERAEKIIINNNKNIYIVQGIRGCGKSTFADIMTWTIREKNSNKKLIRIKFTPRFMNNKDDYYEGFLKLLKNKLLQYIYNNKLSDDIDNISDLVEIGSNEEISKIRKSLKKLLKPNNSTIEENIQEIAEIISGDFDDFNIVIIFDEIDRLSADELMEFSKLLEITKDLVSKSKYQNIYLIVCYDSQNYLNQVTVPGSDNMKFDVFYNNKFSGEKTEFVDLYDEGYVADLKNKLIEKIELKLSISNVEFPNLLDDLSPYIYLSIRNFDTIISSIYEVKKNFKHINKFGDEGFGFAEFFGNFQFGGDLGLSNTDTNNKIEGLIYLYILYKLRNNIYMKIDANKDHLVGDKIIKIKSLRLIDINFAKNIINNNNVVNYYNITSRFVEYLNNKNGKNKENIIKVINKYKNIKQFCEAYVSEVFDRFGSGIDHKFNNNLYFDIFLYIWENKYSNIMDIFQKIKKDSFLYDHSYHIEFSKIQKFIDLIYINDDLHQSFNMLYYFSNYINKKDTKFYDTPIRANLNNKLINLAIKIISEQNFENFDFNALDSITLTQGEDRNGLKKILKVFDKLELYNIEKKYNNKDIMEFMYIFSEYIYKNDKLNYNEKIIKLYKRYRTSIGIYKNTIVNIFTKYGILSNGSRDLYESEVSDYFDKMILELNIQIIKVQLSP